MSDINRNDGHYSGDGLPYNPDPIIQPKDESGNSEGSIQPIETVLRRRPMPLSNLAYGQNGHSRGNDKPAWTLGYILKSTFRYKWTFLLIMILTAAPLLTLIWTQIVPQYQARAEIRVRPIIPHIVFKNDDNGMIPLYSSFLNTQVSIIRSMTVLQRVLDDEKVQKTSWYKNPDESLLSKISGTKLTPMERIRDSLSVRPRSQTEIIDVTFVADKAQDAKDIVNVVVDKYLQYNEEASNATEGTIFDQLIEEEKRLKREIQGMEKSIQDRLNALGTSSPEELISSKRSTVELIAQQLSEVQQKIAIWDWEKNKINEFLKESQSIDSSDSNEVAQEVSEQKQYYLDTEWRQLDKDVRSVKFQIETSKFTESNPRMIELQEQLKFREEMLALRESQIDAQRKSMPNSTIALSNNSGLDYEKQLENIEYQKERAKREEELYLANLNDRQEELDAILKRTQSLEKEKSDLEYAQEVYKIVRDRLEQKNMERNAPGSITQLTSAFVPSKYYNDRRIVFSAMALCAAFGFGFGIAFLRGTMNQVIYASQDMPLPIKVPHLGSIPLIRLKNPLGKMLGEEIEKNQIQLFESVRVIRTKLLLQLNNQESSTVLISSSVAGTGKSSFIKVLGKCMAKTGKKVLMIDTDFYKKTLSRRFGLADRPGIINYLNTKTLDFSGICQTEIPNLSILPAGRHDSDDVMFEGIDNGFFGTYLDELKKKYSVIIMDSSPVLPRADTVIMAHHVSGVIMVERELLSRRENMSTAIERVNSAGGNIWGVVFVGTSEYEKYDHYSSYYETAKV